MKLFCVVLVVYVMALTLFGVDGRGGGTTKGVEDSMGLFARARRHAHIHKRGLENGAGYVNNEEMPPPHFKTRRNVMNNEPPQVNNEEGAPPQFRPRRQLPPPPEGLPPPPEGMPPPPPGGFPAPPA